MSALLLFLRAGGWRYVAGALVLIVIAAAVGSFSHSRFKAGQADRDAYWSNVVEREHAAAALALQEANARAVTAENLAATKINEISKDYEKELTDANAKHAAVVASLRSGATRLRVSVAPGSACRSGGQLPSPSTGAGGDHDAETAELSPAVAGRLADRYHEFENVSRQLRACQAVVQADRDAINGPAR